MKKTLALLLGLLSAFSSQGQAYQPMIRSGVYWDVVLTGDFTHICGLDRGWRVFFPGTTTTIGGRQYQELRGYRYTPDSLSGPFCPPFHLDYSTTDLLALLREDTTTRRVYLGGNDVLLLDFALGVGDTLPGVSGQTRVVTSVGTATLFNGQPRRISYLDGFGGRPPQDYLLEGIGSNYGPFSPVMPGIGFEYRLDAVWENGVLVWGPHQLPLATAAEQATAPLTVAVEPAGRALHCDGLTTADAATLTLRDAVGRTVLRRELAGPNERVALPPLAPGLYFYELMAAGRRAAGRCLLED